MATSFSSAQLERFRREAKKLSRELSITHSEALDRIAARHGYQNWSLLAKHGEGKLAAVAPPSRRPAAKASSAPHASVRYYLHGDVSEDDPSTCFCVRCDLRVPLTHFDGIGFHGDGEDCARYLGSLAVHNEQPKSRKAARGRPDNAPNVLAARALAEREAFEASRSAFHRWLEGQRKRNDIVGELAEDILGDKSFPVRLGTRKEVEARLSRHGDHIVRAVRAAWREFAVSEPIAAGQ